jgi:hypothetical protein
VWLVVVTMMMMMVSSRQTNASHENQTLELLRPHYLPFCEGDGH